MCGTVSGVGGLMAVGVMIIGAIAGYIAAGLFWLLGLPLLDCVLALTAVGGGVILAVALGRAGLAEGPSAAEDDATKATAPRAVTQPTAGHEPT